MQLEIGGENVDEVLKRIGHRAQLRVARIRAAAKTATSITFEGRTIVEQDGKWLVQSRVRQSSFSGWP